MLFNGNMMVRCGVIVESTMCVNSTFSQYYAFKEQVNYPIHIIEFYVSYLQNIIILSIVCGGKLNHDSMIRYATGT